MLDPVRRAGNYTAQVPVFHHLDPIGIETHADRLETGDWHDLHWPELYLKLLEHQEMSDSRLPKTILAVLENRLGVFAMWISDAAAFYYCRQNILVAGHAGLIGFFAVEQQEVLSSLVLAETIRKRPSR